MRRETVKIVICKNCEGTGGTIRYANKEPNNCTDCDLIGTCGIRTNTGCAHKMISKHIIHNKCKDCAHKMISKHIIHNKCKDCEGSGRLQMTFITEPYKTKEQPVNHDGLYDCDPFKNTVCNKSQCYMSGGTCSHTQHEEFAVDRELPSATESCENCAHKNELVCNHSGLCDMYKRRKDND